MEHSRRHTISARAKSPPNLIAIGGPVRWQLNLASYGSGFSSLTFTVKNGATTLLSDKFTSLSAAQKFFTDDPLSLGTFKGSVDLTLSLQVTANKIEGTGISYVVADSAAPAAAAQPASIVIGRSVADAGYRQYLTNALTQINAAGASLGQNHALPNGRVAKPNPLREIRASIKAPSLGARPK